jgi:hypothetical protein
MNQIDEVGVSEFVKGNQGISAVEKLLTEFEAHETKEEKSVEVYRKALSAMTDSATRMIMQMIVSDEERHRSMIHAMAATLEGSLNWTKPVASLEGVPSDTELNRKLSAVTEEFIELETAGLREYKRLLNESSGYYHGLFEVLIRSMVRDSEKHIEMLDFLSRRLRTA